MTQRAGTVELFVFVAVSAIALCPLDAPAAEPSPARSAVQSGKAASPTNSAPDRPRKIYAHFMGCYMAGAGACQFHATDGHRTLGYGGTATDPLKRNLAAWAVNSTGGQYRTFGLAPYDKPLQEEEAADLELRRAMRIGIDGFSFDAWAGGAAGHQLFETMFKICEEKNYPFELTVTIDLGCLDGKKSAIDNYADSIKNVLELHGQSKHLARRDGKPLVLGYQSTWPWVAYLQEHVKADDGEAWEAEVARLRTTPDGWRQVGDAYHEIERRVGEPIYWEFCMSAFDYGLSAETRKQAQPKFEVAAAAEIARQLPAVGDFLGGADTPAMAAAVVAAGAEFCQPILLQYENYGYFQASATGTDWTRGSWQAARELPSTLLQYITWNDYHENTNLSPGYNTRYAYYDLTGYLIDWWKHDRPPVPDHDKVYIFSQKYTHDSKIFPFKAVSRAENCIEVLTILRQAAQVRMPGRDAVWDAPAGFSFHQVPLTAGPVVVEVVRGGKVTTRLELPDAVSERPFRQETGKTAVCTEEAAHWRADFGDRPHFVYSEYGDADQDGLPNWFEMFWFGKFGDMSTATVAKPDDDPDGDGRTNLTEYLEQTDPTLAPAPTAPADPPEKGAKKKKETLDDLLDGN